MSQSRFVQPPHIAGWLVSLFTSAEETESILGDLLEEYSHLALKSEVPFARHWYWRQAVKTVAHLIVTGFCVAPWRTIVAAIGGLLLNRFVSGLPDKLLAVVTDRYLMFWSTHFAAYIWVLNGMLIEHVILAMLVGGIVALATKGGEMIATITLALVLCAWISASLVWAVAHLPIDVTWMLWLFADPVTIVVGGAIVRTRRSAAATQHSNA